MSLHRFFLDDQVISKESQPEFKLRLSDDDRHHAKVLRLSPGEHIAVVDASGDYFECEIIDASDDLIASIAMKGFSPADDVEVTLLQGLPKGDKMDDIIRQCTEIGVDAIIPIACSRSVSVIKADRVEKKLSRWNGIAKSASMQSGRMRIPSISKPMRISEIAGIVSSMDLVIIFWEETSLEDTIDSILFETIARCDALPIRIAILIGPEGGLTEDEVDSISLMGNAHAATLGDTILRTETAAVVASALTLHLSRGLIRNRELLEDRMRN